MLKMWKLIVLIFLIPGTLMGGLPHLLVYISGQGAFFSAENQNTTDLVKARYLPNDQLISVRSKSGIETFTPGFQFRFGANTQFICISDGVSISTGSMFVRSRKISNSMLLKAPEVSIFVEGSGTCLVNVEPSGGLKFIGLIGKLQVKSESRKISHTLLPGDLLFALPENRGIGNKMTVNLSKIIEGSFLVSGFPNSHDFQNSLNSIAGAQSDLTYHQYGAVVGQSKTSNSFEILPDLKHATSPDHSEDNSSTKDSEVFSADPLTDLLGRKSYKSKSFQSVGNSNSDSPAVSSESSKRPFPSKLLRR